MQYIGKIFQIPQFESYVHSLQFNGWTPNFVVVHNTSSPTQKLYKEVVDFLNLWKRNREKNALTFSVSPKLTNSGENWDEAIKPDVICQYQDVGFVYLKFVVATEEDLQDAERAVDEYRKRGFKGPVYLMPVGGVERVYTLNNRAVAEMAMRKGWRYSDRLQVPLFKNEWGT
jgi:organic radical activating enzyme